MDLCHGTLDDLLKGVAAQKQFCVRFQILSIAIQILEGLHYCHTRGQVHRDLTPRNGALLLYANWQQYFIVQANAIVTTLRQLTATALLISAFRNHSRRTRNKSHLKDLAPRAIQLLSLQTDKYQASILRKRIFGLSDVFCLNWLQQKGDQHSNMIITASCILKTLKRIRCLSCRARITPSWTKSRWRILTGR